MKNLDGLNIYEAENEIMEYLSPLFTRKPFAPKLKSNSPSAEEIKVYSEAVKTYEEDLSTYRNKNDFYREESNRLYALLKGKVKEDSGLNSIVPEQYRDNVYSYAYQQGHGSGYSEVYTYLLELVNIFE
jgi:hypothetical protein